MCEKRGQPSPSVRVWTSLNHSPRLTFTCLALLYLAITSAQAASRLLWGDELITLAIARTGSVGAIWTALARGADPNPPLSHIVVMLATRAFGGSALAVRLPFIAFMLLAMACVWTILRRWVAPAFAATGALAFMATRGFDYSYEARSYAPLAAFSVAALACWLRAADQVHSRRSGRPEPATWPPQSLARSLWLAGMTLSLALAVSSNYYGVLAWFPIAAGELVLSRRTRRVYPATWLCLLLAALPLVGYLPLIQRNIAEFAPHAWNRPQISMLTESYLLLVEGVFWPVAAGAVVLWWQSRKARIQPPFALGMEAHERTALAVLLAYPFLGLAAAWTGAAMISPRCVIPVCCGFGIAAGLLAARLARGAKAGLLLLSLALVWVAARESACAVLLRQQRVSFQVLLKRMEQVPGGPVYISDSSLALALAHYGSPNLRQRIVFPIDFAAIHRWEREDSGEQNLWAGRDRVFPIRIVPYTPGLATEKPALVIARPGGWLIRQLAGDGLVLKDATGPEELKLFGGLGGVFTPMGHEETRLLAPVR